MIIIILLICVFLLLIVLSFVWPPDSPWAPRWRTKRTEARKALRFAGVGKNDVVYELGCGDGEVILAATKDFKAQAVGIEIDPIRFLIAKLRVVMAGVGSLATVMRKDFKQVNVAPATVIYMYLVPSAMKKLLPKLKKELRSSTKIVSYRYKIPLDSREKTFTLVKADEKARVYVYLRV